VPAPRAVLVDIGETLFAEQPMDRRAAADALVADPRFAPHLPDADALEAAQPDRPGAWSVLGWLRGMLPEALAVEAELLVWEAGVRMTPMPGARDALAALRSASVPVGAVSNTRFSGRAWQHVMEARDLAVDFVVSSADLGARKPDPAIFRAALGRLRLPPGDVWFVGDSWERDVRGAAAAGLLPVRFGKGPPPPRPHPPCAVACDWPAFVAFWKSAGPRRVS